MTPPRSPAAWLAILVLLALALGGITLRATYAIDRIRADAERAALASASTLGLTVTLQWAETMRRVRDLDDLAQQVTRAMIDHMPGTAERMAQLRSAMQVAGPAFIQVSATDEKGVLLWSTLGPVPAGVSLARREPVEAIIAQGRDSWVGKPDRDTLSGLWSIHFSDAVRDPDRTLRGITTVTLDAGIAQTWARDIDATGRTSLTIICDDGTVLARSDGTHIGTLMPPRSPVFTLARKGDGSATAHVISPLDGVSRFTAIRQVPGSQILVAVSLDAAAQLAASEAQITRSIQSNVLLGAAVVALAAAALAVLRHQQALARERRQRERLEQRDRLLRQIGEQANDVICLLDAQGCYLYVSDAVRTASGHDPATLIGKDFGLSMVREDRHILKEGLRRLRRDGGTWRGSGRVHHSDGSLHWMEAELVAIEPGDADAADGAGEDGNILAIVRDVTARVQAETALRQATEQLEAALRLGPGELYRMTRDEAGRPRVAFPSDALERQRGETAAPACRHIIRAATTLDTPEMAAAIDQCRSTGHAVIECSVAQPDGTIVWIRNEMRLAEPFDAAIVGYLTDVTAEHALRQRLKLAERLATLGEVTTGIAHEINQPLAAMALAAQNGLRALQRTPANTRLAESKFAVIDAQAMRLGKVVHHIQTVSRGEEVPLTRFRIADLIADSLDLCTARLRASRVEVALQLAADLPGLHARRVLVEQVLMNLIVNACDAYDEQNAGVQNVAATARLVIAAAADANGVSITVADQAGGVPHAVIERVFDPFFTTKQPGKGVGLGLSLSAASMTGMGGSIGVRNAGGGAVFTLAFPAARCCSDFETVQEEA
jgi:PAS domain S-box-containing protein